MENQVNKLESKKKFSNDLSLRSLSPGPQRPCCRKRLTLRTEGQMSKKDNSYCVIKDHYGPERPVHILGRAKVT